MKKEKSFQVRLKQALLDNPKSPFYFDKEMEKYIDDLDGLNSQEVKKVNRSTSFEYDIAVENKNMFLAMDDEQLMNLIINHILEV